MDTNNPQDPGLRVEIVRQIIWLSRKHFQLNVTQAEETDIGSGQIPVLLELNRWGEMNQRELAERTRVTPATMSGTLKRMEKNGFIVRTTDENDARISLVRLTEEGKRQCENAKRIFDETCCQMLEPLDEDSLNTLRALLTRIQNHLGGHTGCRTDTSKKE